jgi:hypothetical protein
MLNDMADYFNVSSDYILGRSDYRHTIKLDSSLLILNEKEKDLIRKMRMLTPQNIDKILGMIELKISEQETSASFLKEKR